MLGDARGILGIEVVLARAGHDLDDREGDVVHDGDGEFIAIDEGFGYQRSAVLEGFFQGRTEFLLGLDNDRADTRALTGRLDDDRQVEALFNVGSDGFAVLSGEIVGKGRCSNAGPLESGLAHDLVHANSTGHDAGTGIGDPHHFTQALDDTVFAVAAVKGVEDDVDTLFGQGLANSFGTSSIVSM